MINAFRDQPCICEQCDADIEGDHDYWQRTKVRQRFIMQKHDLDEMFDWHMKYDPLFVRLFNETKKEKDPARLELGAVLLEGVMLGKFTIIQSPMGELLFEHSQPN